MIGFFKAPWMGSRREAKLFIFTFDLVPVRDASATAKSLAALLSDPALRKRMGQAGRARYEDRYRVEVFQRGMEDALSSVGGTAEKVGR